MRTKTIRVEQEQADTAEVDKLVNEEIKQLESQGHKVRDLRVAVGRDADASSGIPVRYSVTIILLYE